MARKRFQAEQIIGKLREAEVDISKDQAFAAWGNRHEIIATLISG